MIVPFPNEVKRGTHLLVNDIYYSIQGEGFWVGTPMIFIRLAKCNLDCKFCDTNFERGELLSLFDILKAIRKYDCSRILWTGGEPTLQLKFETVAFFASSGYWQAIETNGTREVPLNIDWITVSPKLPLKKMFENFQRNFPNEIKILVDKNTRKLPKIDNIQHKWISPIFNDDKPNFENIDNALELVSKYAKDGWRLSVQVHKFLKIK